MFTIFGTMVDQCPARIGSRPQNDICVHMFLRRRRRHEGSTRDSVDRIRGSPTGNILILGASPPNAMPRGTTRYITVVPCICVSLPSCPR